MLYYVVVETVYTSIPSRLLENLYPSPSESILGTKSLGDGLNVCPLPIERHAEFVSGDNFCRDLEDLALLCDVLWPG